MGNMITEWLDKIHNCGFTASIDIDDEPAVTLHWVGRLGPETHVFRGSNIDLLMAGALLFAETYDAYVNTAAHCGFRH